MSKMRRPACNPASGLEVPDVRTAGYSPPCTVWRIWHPLLAALLLAGLSVSAQARLVPPVAPYVAMTPEKIEEIHAANMADLATLSGKNQQAIVVAMQKSYPDHRLVDTCEGSFKREGSRDFALGLISLKQRSVVYVVISREPDGRHITAELLSFPLAINEKGMPEGKGVYLECNSWTRMRRIKADYAGRHSTSAPDTLSFSDRTLRSRFDVACVVPPGDMEFLCYGYDFGKGKFDMVGGWTNE